MIGSARDIIFHNASVGWVITSRYILRTLDGGYSWQPQVSISAGWSLSLVNNQELWAVGDFLLAHTIDGGQNWYSEKWPQADEPFRNKPYFTDIEFINEHQGWVVGSEPNIAYTPDRGQTWDEQHIDTRLNPRIAVIVMYNETLGWTGGTGGLLLRTTQGNHYNTSQSTSPKNNQISWETTIIDGILVSFSVIIIIKKKNRKKE